MENEEFTAIESRAPGPGHVRKALSTDLALSRGSINAVPGSFMNFPLH